MGDASTPRRSKNLIFLAILQHFGLNGSFSVQSLLALNADTPVTKV